MTVEGKRQTVDSVIREVVGPEGAVVLDEIAKDPVAFLNTPQVPKDAGEYAEGLARILARIPDGWGRWIGCGKGWYPLLIEVDERLAAIDPDYAVHQVKEKFATLRYYFQLTSGDWEAARDIVNDVAHRSAITCEVCGEPGACRGGGWLRTLCDGHAEGRPLMKEEDDDDTD